MRCGAILHAFGKSEPYYCARCSANAALRGGEAVPSNDVVGESE